MHNTCLILLVTNGDGLLYESSSLQDTQGESYDYRSIMHYDSTAFSKNGKDTITTVVNGFTSVIGQATDLSKNDIIKVLFISMISLSS